MKRVTFLLIPIAAVASVIAFSARAFRPATQAEVPIFVTEIPAGYREWRYSLAMHLVTHRTPI
jgi:hypothetical protein